MPTTTTVTTTTTDATRQTTTSTVTTTVSAPMTEAVPTKEVSTTPADVLRGLVHRLPSLPLRGDSSGGRGLCV